MLQTQRINELARKAVSLLPEDVVLGVSRGRGSGSEGEDTIRVRLVVRAEKARCITGDQSIEAIFELQELLRSEGERRFATIDHIGDDELADHGGS